MARDCLCNLSLILDISHQEDTLQNIPKIPIHKSKHIKLSDLPTNQTSMNHKCTLGLKNVHNLSPNTSNKSENEGNEYKSFFIFISL